MARVASLAHSLAMAAPVGRKLALQYWYRQLFHERVAAACVFTSARRKRILVVDQRMVRRPGAAT